MQEGRAPLRSSPSHLRQLSGSSRWRDRVSTAAAVLLTILFAQSAAVSLWNLWLSPILELSDRINELDDDCHSRLQPGHASSAARFEGSGHMVMYGEFRGPRDICGLSSASIAELLEKPHNCRRTGERVWLAGRQEWMKAGDLLHFTADRPKAGKDPIVCAIVCVDHQGPCQHDKCLIPVHIRRNTTDPVVAVQLLEDGAYDTVRPDMAFQTILDAGGNCGVSSIVFATMFPSATIVTVEPSSSNYAMLKRNTKAYPNVMPMRVALWPRVAKLALTRGSRTPGLFEWGYMVHEADQLPADAEVLDSLFGVSVDFLLRLSGLPGFDLLKIDIEGSEKELMSRGPHNPKGWLDSAKMAIVEVHNDMRKGSHGSVADTFYSRDNWRWVRQWEEYHVYKKKGWDEGGGP